MKKILLLSILISFAFAGNSQNPVVLPLLYNWDDNTIPPAFYGAYNDCWGYVDAAGREYAIIGSSQGTYFFDITIPTSPVMVSFQKSKDTVTLAIHRDFKTYSHYAYGVADEGDNSLQIFDLQYLPDSVVKVYDSNQFSKRCHNLFVSGDKLFLASNTVGSVFNAMDVLSLANPANPTFLSSLNSIQFWHVHDVFVRNDTAYCSNGNDGLFIYSYVNPSNPVLKGSLTAYPQQGYNHSSWATPDGKALVFADETHGAALKILNVSNYSALNIYSFFQSNLLNIPNPSGPNGSIPHNPFIRDNLCFISYYHDGVQVYDISNKNNAVKVAYYDTYTQHSDYASYQGCWGVYPFLPSGNIIASDMKNGLFILNGSAILGIHQQNPQANSGYAYFNSSDNSFNLSITSAKGQKSLISVFDMTGNLVAEKTVDIPAGNSSYKISAVSLASGMYLIKASGADLNFFKKIVKR